MQPLPPAVCRIAEDGRPGFARERSIMWYTSSYLAGVMWLSLRLSPLYPASLTPLDPALCSATIAVYLYGFASPVRTVLVIQHVDSAALVLPHPLPWRIRRSTLPSLSLSPGPWLGCTREAQLSRSAPSGRWVSGRWVSGRRPRGAARCREAAVPR